MLSLRDSVTDNIFGAAVADIAAPRVMQNANMIFFIVQVSFLLLKK